MPNVYRDVTQLCQLQLTSIGLITVKFGPVAADRLYSLLYRKSLSETDKWTTVDQYRPVESMDETTWEVRPQATNGGFYRLRVELMQ